jgi:hypothetical protein
MTGKNDGRGPMADGRWRMADGRARTGCPLLICKIIPSRRLPNPENPKILEILIFFPPCEHLFTNPAVSVGHFPVSLKLH